MKIKLDEEEREFHGLSSREQREKRTVAAPDGHHNPAYTHPGSINGSPVETVPWEYRRTDQGIRANVLDEISAKTELTAEEIEVTVDNGEVTLEGSVSSESEAEHAEQLAHAVVGVKSVKNHLVTPG